MKGIYELELKTGGKLAVSSSGWAIKYYFSGPDLRYNGTFVTIPGNQIDLYIKAWKNNFERFQELKNTLPNDGNYMENGEMNMYISIGRYSKGVGLHYSSLKSLKAEVDNIIEDYEYAKKAAERILIACKDI